MALSVVQSTVLSNSTWSGSFGSNVGAGNTVFLLAYQYTSSGATMGSSAPLFNGSAAPGASMLFDKQGASANTVYGAIWMLPNLAGGAASCALTNSGGTVDSNVGLIGIEVSGLGTAPVLDSASPNPQTGTNSTGNPSSGATGNIAASPDFILGMAVEYGVGLTLPGGAWSGLLTTSGFCAGGWQIATSSGSPYTYSATGSSASWASGVAAVKVTPASGVTGVGAAVSVAGGIGTPSGGGNTTGVGSQVSVAAGVGSPSSGDVVTGVGSQVAVAGGVGTPAGGAKVTGVAASVAVAAGVGSPSSGDTVTGVGAQVAVAGGVGAPSGSANVTGVASQVTTGAGLGTPSGGAQVPGTGSAVGVAGGVGTPSGGANAAGVGAQVAVAGGIGSPSGGGSANVTGVGAMVTTAAGVGALAAAANVQGVAALVALAGGIGSPAGIINGVTGVAALVSVIAGTGTPVGGGFIVVIASRACSFQARALVTAQATMEFNAGVPAQAGLVTLASDPWIAMYPDTL